MASRRAPIFPSARGVEPREAHRPASASGRAVISFRLSAIEADEPDRERGSFALDQEPVEGAERGELEANVGTRLAAFHEPEEIVAEIIRGAFQPWANTFPGSECLRAPAGKPSGVRPGKRCVRPREKRGTLLDEFVAGGCAQPRRYSGFSIFIRVTSDRARSLYWLLKMGGGLVEITS